jgi:anti-anti-sigma factor
MADTATITLAGDLTIAKAADLQQTFVNEVADAASVVLHAEAVERLDTAGLQLLLALHKQCQSRGGEMQVKDMQHSMQELIQLAGCGDILA